jgi:hypothetical protein
MMETMESNLEFHSLELDLEFTGSGRDSYTSIDNFSTEYSSTENSINNPAPSESYFFVY